MKRLLIICLLAAFAAVQGCAPSRPQVVYRPGASLSQVPSYAGPKARVAVAEFEMRGVKAGGEVADSLRRMLVASLVNSGRFEVVETPPKDDSKAPVCAIVVTVTEFEPQASGGTAGVGGGGGIGSGLMGGLLGTQLNKAHMAMEIRVVDTASSSVIASTRVQGQAAGMAGGPKNGGVFGGWGLDAGLLAFANTPMEKAIRICIAETIRYVSQNTPDNYYQY